MALVTEEGGEYSVGRSHVPQDPPKMPEFAHTPARGKPEQVISGVRQAATSEPYRVSFSPSGVEVTGRLANASDADKLIRAIEALKALLPPAQEPEPTAPPTQSAQAGVSLMITQQQKAALRERGYTDEQIREMRPEDAHRALGLVN